MPQLDIICLANSRKHGGRCVAGLRVDGSGWLRLVGPRPDGSLDPPHYTLANGSEAGLLDVMRVGVRASKAAPHQPENWVIDGPPWTLLARPMATRLIPIVRQAIVPGPELLKGFLDRVHFVSFLQQQAAASLALIAPDNIELYHRASYKGSPQARGRFYLGAGAQRACYDLVITDPHWGEVVIQQGPCTLKQADGKFVITISLSEPYRLYCYKLIAAIIPLPPAIAAGF